VLPLLRRQLQAPNLVSSLKTLSGAFRSVFTPAEFRSSPMPGGYLCLGFPLFPKTKPVLK